MVPSDALAHSLTLEEARPYYEMSGVTFRREAWPTGWFYIVELNPVRLEVRMHPDHYRKEITEEDRQAGDWYAYHVNRNQS